MEPLASKIRPKNLEEFIGQEHLVTKSNAQKGIAKGPLRVAIEEKHLFSFILWGPPGVGKTTLARIYAKALNADYHELSAVSAGKEDIRKIIEGEEGLFGPKILFLDEIHRFNKAQQDFLLPAVESGKLTLIGATTENPSFEVISPLLSRCRVFVLEELKKEEMRKILARLPAQAGTGHTLSAETLDWLVGMAGGDARQAITMVENTAKLYGEITVENLKQMLQSKFLRYDKKGEEHYNTISAFIKGMRASQPDAALYYLARMIEAGEDPKFIARRMVIFASEDVSNADPFALVLAVAAFQAVESVGLPEARINLAHVTTYLATRPKDNASYVGLLEALKDAREHGNLEVPMHLRNAVTSLMRDLGYGKGYRYVHDDPAARKEQQHLPESLKGKRYYRPKPL